MFLLIHWVFISFVLSWILIAIVNCTNLVFLVLNKYILLFQHFNSFFSGQNNFLRVNCKMQLLVYFILFLLKTGWSDHLLSRCVLDSLMGMVNNGIVIPPSQTKTDEVWRTEPKLKKYVISRTIIEIITNPRMKN